MIDPGPGPATNRLLAVLPAIERERVYPGLELVSMPLGTVLYESGSKLDHVYFPADSIVSLLYVMADGASAEIAVVGNDGHGRRRAVHGRRDDAQPGRRAERRRRVPAFRQCC